MQRTKLRVSDFMTTSPEVVRPDASLAQAGELMARARVRHLPVIDDDQNLIGVVSDGDLSLLASMPMVREADCPVTQAMRTELFTCGPEAWLHAVATEMVEKRIGSAIVVPPDEPGRVLGIFTTVDALRALIQYTQPYLRDPGQPASASEEE